MLLSDLLLLCHTNLKEGYEHCEKNDVAIQTQHSKVIRR
jgi:hypothetical protein